MKKILTIVGARPQFIKAAAVSRAIKKTGKLNEVIVHTGQHYDKNMSDVFFEEMEIPHPQVNLNIHGLSHGAMTGQMLEGIEKIILSEKPDGLMVYGDTNSTLAGALAASKLMVPVVHVEAGLRSFNMAMPEEINRIVTDRISHLLFCPTESAIENLKQEGFDGFPVRIVKNGDVMNDAALYYGSFSEKKSTIIQKLGLTANHFILATIHRQENTDNIDLLNNIIKALNELHKDTRVILPIHPRTRKILSERNIQTNITLIDPVGYFDIIELLKNTSIVITDSGGLQKEAYFFGKHCVIIREQTEWVELVLGGYAKLAGTNTADIINFTWDLMDETSDFSVNLYGNGGASDIVADELLNL